MPDRPPGEVASHEKPEAPVSSAVGAGVPGHPGTGRRPSTALCQTQAGCERSTDRVAPPGAVPVPAPGPILGSLNSGVLGPLYRTRTEPET